ncbi:MAG: alpha/beta hydrolase family protein [Planctomycetota bacterium]|jgi:pimeloyl-ACP methyl ester carboxylesterase
MENIRYNKTIPLVLVLLISITSSVWADTQDILGSWMGILRVGDMELRIAYTIQEDQDGSLSATLHSLDEVVYDIPVNEILYEDNQLTLISETAQSTYEGRLVKGRNSVYFDGQWKQAGMSFDLDLRPVEEIPRPNRPQDPQPPFPYEQQEVVFENIPAGIQLAGTLTIPEGTGPFPVLVTISGSGSQDRNSNFFEHKPFWVIADYLARLGMAVLRYDDRGVGGSTNSETEATSADLAGDVQAAVTFLLDHQDIDPNRIGLIGHSEGGMIAPMVATEIEDIALIVLLAGPGVPGSKILLDQNEDIFRANGAPESVIETRLIYLRRIFEILQDYPDDEIAKEMIKQAFVQIFGSGSSQEELNSEAEAWTSVWMRFFVLYDPGPTLAQVTCPVLALFCERDIQVDVNENLPVMESILAEAGHTDYLVHELPELNHLFQTAETGVIEEYAQIEETFSPIALDLIGAWISERFFDDIEQ